MSTYIVENKLRLYKKDQNSHLQSSTDISHMHAYQHLRNIDITKDLYNISYYIFIAIQSQQSNVHTFTPQIGCSQ
jgi:hypothetical protein